MAAEIRDYDVSEHLRTPEEMTAYLDACIAECDGDAAFVAKALGDIARAKGMAEFVKSVHPKDVPAETSHIEFVQQRNGERSDDIPH